MSECRPCNPLPLFSLLFLLLASCAGARVASDHDPAADFSRYSSFRWADSSASSLGGGSLFGHPFLERRIRDAVEGELASRGFRLIKASGEVDFTVALRVSSRAVEFTAPDPAASWHLRYGFGPSVRQDRWWWWGGYPLPIRCSEEVALAIIIADGRTGRPVWSASAREFEGWGDNGAELQRRIARIVGKLLDRFPPPPPRR